MGLDTNIALQAKLPQFESPLAQMAQFSQVQGLQNQNQLAQYTLAKAKREDEDTIAQRNLLTGAGGDLEAGYNALLKGGYLDKAMAIKKAQQEQLKTQSEIGKNNAEAGNKNQEVAAKRIEMIGQTMGALQSVQGVTPQHVVNGLQHLVDIGAIPADQLPRLTAEIPQDPAALPGWLDAKGKSALKVADQMKYTTVDANTTANNRTSLDVAAGNNRTSLQVGAANNSTALQVGAGHDAATIAGQNKGQVVQGEQGPVLVNPRTGVGQSVMVDGQPVGPKLKDIPPSVNTAIINNTQNLSKVKTAIDLLSGKDVGGAKGDANATGWKGFAPNGILNRMDPQGTDTRAMISDIGSLVLHDRSGAAVTASESPRLMPFIPLATDDNATAKKKLTRFMEIYQQETNAMAETYSKDQGYKPNPILSRAATPSARVVDAVNNGESAKLASLKPVSVQTAADYAKLPSGTVFTAPDGSQRVKK